MALLQADLSPPAPESLQPASGPIALPEALRGVVRRGRDLVGGEASATRLDPDRLVTGWPAIDGLLPEGLSRGSFLEIRGRGSSGRFALTLAWLAGVTGRGEVAALVDLGSHLQPRRASAYGIDLDRLLWIRPQTRAEAQAAAEIVVDSRLPLVVVDLGPAPVPGGRGVEAHWLRLARQAKRHRVALIVSAPYAVQSSCAQLVLRLDRRRSRWAAAGPQQLLHGVETHLTVEKDRRGENRRRGGDFFWPSPEGRTLAALAESEPTSSRDADSSPGRPEVLEAVG